MILFQNYHSSSILSSFTEFVFFFISILDLNLSAGGNLLKKGEEEAIEVIEELASSDEGWSNERSKVHRVAYTTDHDTMSTLSDKLDALTMKFDCMTMGQPSQEPQGNMEDANYVQQGGNRYYNNSRPNFNSLRIQPVWEQGASQSLLWESQ